MHGAGVFRTATARQAQSGGTSPQRGRMLAPINASSMERAA